MATFIAMLRSINVSGHNRLPMADLRDLVTSLGFADVATYVQSGNVVFTGSGRPAAVGQAIEDRIATDLGLTVPVLVRSKPQLRTLLGASPYLDLDADPKTLHVTFLAARPEAGAVAKLGEERHRFGKDTFEVVGSDVFLHCPGGYGNTKLNNAFLERKLGVTGTTRNWRTVTTLAEMAGL